VDQERLSNKEITKALKELVTLNIVKVDSAKLKKYRFPKSIKDEMNNLFNFCTAFISALLLHNKIVLTKETTPREIETELAYVVAAKIIGDKLGIDYVSECLRNNDEKICLLVEVLANAFLFTRGA